MRILIAGGGGRESAFALKIFVEGKILCAVMPHNNPTISDCVNKSGGVMLIGDCNNPQIVADFAVQQAIDYAFINTDDALANGVVDALLACNIKTIGGSKAATRIEWDKVFAMDLLSSTLPEFTPFYRVADSESALTKYVSEFQQIGLEIVVKPQGLTGGKGVKVMPIHLQSYGDSLTYGKELLEGGASVLLVEKLTGAEFTVMGFSDGHSLRLCPATYDYPYRFVGDVGAGTGGMGSYTIADGHLPFMSKTDMINCQTIMQTVIDTLRNQGRAFQGVLNGGFFRTPNGIKFMEFNSRFGDPEAMNIFSLLSSSFTDLLVAMWNKQLIDADLRFANKASVVKYIVAKEYPDASPAATHFDLPLTDMQNEGIKVYFSSAEKAANGGFNTLRRSRIVALAAVGDDTKTLSQRLNAAIEKHIIKGDGRLDYRSDIGEDVPTTAVNG